LFIKIILFKSEMKSMLSSPFLMWMKLLTYLLTTYLLTPWCRVLLEKLTGFQLVKKFPAFYWTRKFVTAFTSASHLSLSWATVQAFEAFCVNIS
jgi:hypothetical protein